MLRPHRDEDSSVAQYLPHGVVAVITPWNFPLTLAMRSIAPALAAGNAVVLKPDHQTPISGGVLLGHLFEQAGLPAGALAVLPGPGREVGNALVEDPRVAMVSFTGSTEVGRTIAQSAATHLKKVALELGGKNPHVVLADADVTGAAASGAWGTFRHQGQVCMGIGRHIVDRSVSERYAHELVARARALRVGDAWREDVDMGPMINAAQVDRVLALVDDARAHGARVLFEGERDRNFLAPIVVAGVTPAMRLYFEEVFGPVAVLIDANDDADAIRIANDTEYGLSASVHSADPQRAARVADRVISGMVHINGQTANDNAWSPMGGVKASGSGGRFGGASNREMFTHTRWRTQRNTPDYGRFPTASA